MRRIITAPTALVVTVDEAKEFGPIGLDCTDEIVTSLIRAATADIENRLWDRAILTQKIAVSLDGALPRVVDLEPNITDLVSITRWTRSDASEVVDATTYTVGLADGFVETLNACWPSPARERAAFTVTYQAGWLTPADVPADVRVCVLRMVKAHYDNRDPIGPVGATMVTPEIVTAIGRSYSNRRLDTAG